MNEKEILARTYKDSLTVYRSQMTIDEETKESITKEVLIYDSAKCALSLSNNSAPDREDFTSKVENEHKLFTMPDIEMLSGDKAVIVTEAGQLYEGITSKTHIYKSHGETTFKIETTS